MQPVASTSTLNKLLDELVLIRHSRTRFLLATVSVLAALTIAVCTQLIFGSLAALIFAVAVILSTSLFGLVAGLCTVVLAVLVLDFFYIPPIFSLNLDASTLRMGAGLLAFAGLSHFAKQQISVKIRHRKAAAQIQGLFDGIEDGRIYGWAFDPKHPSRPVFLTVMVNQQPVACVAAVHFRPDLAHLMIYSGNYAFYADLGWVFPVETEALVDVRLPSGESLPGAPCTLRISPRTRPQRPTVLFMHIPKTAGTAFREAIAANYHHADIAYLYPTLPGLLVKDLRALPIEQRRSYRVVIGHFQYGMHEALPQECEYITVVREPTARIQSQYAFFRQTQPELVGDSGRFLSLEAVFERKLTVDFDNAMVRCFSGVDQRVFPPGSLTRDIFDLAVRNLRTAFTFVGHQETSAASFARLRDRFDWRASESLDNRNAGSISASSEITGGLLKLIRHYNQWDYLFYEEILRAFPRINSRIE
jgi:hypothetical protein